MAYPCKFYKDGKEISLNEVKKYIFDNYDKINKEVGGQKKVPPITPIEPKENIHSEQPSQSFKKSEFVRARNRMGLAEFEDKNTTTNLKEQTKADKTIAEWKEKGTYNDNINEIVERAKKGQINTQEQFLLAKHLADLDATVNSIKDINSKEYDKALNEYANVLEAADNVRSEAGRQLRMIAINKGELLTLADWMAERKDSLGVDLTEKQKAETKAMFEDYEAKLKIADEKQAEAQAEISKLKAELENKSIKEKQKTLRKRNREELKKERTDLIASIKDKWNNAGKDIISSDIPYRKQIVAIAPDVMKLFANITETGVSKLEDIISDIHEAIGGIISKKDIQDVIAGEYNEKKPTLTELQSRRKDLREEARLLNELERLQNNEPKTERETIQKNQRLVELRNKIKDWKTENPNPTEQLNAIKNRNEKEIQKIDDKIANKDFETKKRIPFDENAALRKANPKLWKEALDSFIAKQEAKDKLELAKRRDELEKRNKWEKAVDTTKKLVSTSKAIKAGIDDSVTFVQLGLAVMANKRKALSSKLQAIKAINNQEFKRQIAAFHNSPIWNIVQASKLDITEPKSLSKENVEELYSGNLLDTKIGGKVNLWTNTGGIFERLFTSMGNNLRWKMFEDRVFDLQSQGKTFESHPEEYKAAARFINEMTGRGKINEKVQGAMPVISPVIWAPKMLSSTLNILGVSDIAGTLAGAKGRENIGTKGLYRELTPNQRKYAAIQMTKGIGTGVATMVALGMAGWKVNYNPQSTDFGTVTTPDGNTKYNVFGRFSGMVKLLFQMSTGEKEDTQGKEVDLDKKGRGQVLYKFLRGKETPAAGLATDLWLNSQKDAFTGEKITLKSLPDRLLTPISFNDIQKGLEQDGSIALLTRWLPSLEGIQVTDKRDFVDNLEKLVERNTNYNDVSKEKILNYKQKGREITEAERNNFVKERDGIITKSITKMYNEGFPIKQPNGQVKNVPYKDMSREQLVKITTLIKTHATDEAKEKLFGKHKKTNQEIKTDNIYDKAKDNFFGQKK